MRSKAVDDKAYARVLARVAPRVIASDREHARLLGEVESLMDKGDMRTAEEDAALDLIVSLIQAYEAKRHPLPDPNPREMLVYLMEIRGLKQTDLLPVFKSSGYVSDVINGKRGSSKAHARGLADFFKVSVEVFV